MPSAHRRQAVAVAFLKTSSRQRSLRRATLFMSVLQSQWRRRTGAPVAHASHSSAGVLACMLGLDGLHCVSRHVWPAAGGNRGAAAAAATAARAAPRCAAPHGPDPAHHPAQGAATSHNRGCSLPFWRPAACLLCADAFRYCAVWLSKQVHGMPAWMQACPFMAW